MHAISLTSDQRNRSMRYIISDLRAVFQSSASWMSFMNLPRFFATVLDPLRRTEMQPSLLLSILALGVLSQSSELERGIKGRQRALKLLDMAHGALQSSLAAGWVDVGLAQAGWVNIFDYMRDCYKLTAYSDDHVLRAELASNAIMATLAVRHAPARLPRPPLLAHYPGRRPAPQRNGRVRCTGIPEAQHRRRPRHHDVPPDDVDI